MNPSFYSTILDLPFDEINLVDTEYRSSPGNRPEPVCLVRWELRRGLKQKVLDQRARRGAALFHRQRCSTRHILCGGRAQLPQVYGLAPA